MTLEINFYCSHFFRFMSESRKIANFNKNLKLEQILENLLFASKFVNYSHNYFLFANEQLFQQVGKTLKIMPLSLKLS